MSLRQTILELKIKIDKIRQELPLLEIKLETLNEDKQLVFDEISRLTTLIQRLKQQETDIIEDIQEAIKQTNIGIQYRELFERYEKYKDLGNSTSDSLKMHEKMLEVLRKILSEELEKKYNNNPLTDINTKILSANNEHEKAKKKLTVINNEISSLTVKIFDKKSAFSDLTREINNLNIQLGRGLLRIKQKKDRKKSTKKRTKKGGKWSIKYKRTINCKRPKGFSQKQYCKYKK
jgi:chromosome segregation ATPase